MILLDSLFMAAVLAVCLGAGRTALRLINVPGLDGEERNLFGFAAGLMFLAWGVMVLGLTKHLTVASLWILIALLGLGSIPGLREIFTRSDSAPAPETERNPLARWNWAPLAFWIGLCLLNWIFVYSPPRAGDELFYHLNVPKRNLQFNQFAAFPEIPFSFLPMTLEALYTFFLGTRNVMTARMLHFVLGVLVSFAAGRWGQRYLKAPWMWTAALCYSMPVFVTQSGVGDSDFGYLFYLVLALWAFRRLEDNPSPAWFFLAVFCAAGSGAVKYQGAPFFAALLLIAGPGVWAAVRRSGTIRPIHVIAAAALGAFVCGFTPLRNYFLVGNPFYPVRHPAGPPQEYFAILVREAVSTRDWQHFWTLPFTLASGSFVVGTGPLLLALLPGFFLLRPWSKDDVRAAAVIVLGSILTYLAFSDWWTARFFLPMILLANVFAARVLLTLFETKMTRRIALFFLALGVVPGAFLSAGFAANRLKFVLGMESADQFMARSTDPYHPWDFIKGVNAAVPADRTLFFLGPSGQFYYWEPRVVCLDRRSLWDQPDPQKVLEVFRRNGFDYFIFPSGEWETVPAGRRHRATPEIIVPWLTDNFLSDNFVTVMTVGDYSLLKRKETPL